MKVSQIIQFLESIAPLSLQESYDNAGLITGNPDWECSGLLCTLDSTEDVVEEAIAKGCNLVVAHHPIIFQGIKKLNGKNYVERTIIKAIKSDIAIYAIHTNLDNIISGVNGRIADKLGLINRKVLLPKENSLKKLFTFVPTAQTATVLNALFETGAGRIGNYSECSFSVNGLGTFKPGSASKPFVGMLGEQHQENEDKIEIVFPSYLEQELVASLRASHPYEEVAFDIIQLVNRHPEQGAGLFGELPTPLSSEQFLALLKSAFQLPTIRHTKLDGEEINKVAICGGAGSFLISKALAVKADAFVTADLKYHEFFDADSKLVLCDIGHFESEQFTIELLADLLSQKFPTFAVLKSVIQTNPVYYYF
ncbi:MAG: Nif3-like dinuclear metal center hexameric protein [Chitinophagaceae bacterium]|nr:Nif3-like dinuclear metal center hexameric protein [Chitinophagaceae bacterium]